VLLKPWTRFSAGQLLAVTLSAISCRSSIQALRRACAYCFWSPLHRTVWLGVMSTTWAVQRFHWDGRVPDQGGGHPLRPSSCQDMLALQFEPEAATIC
jgi:hypothetical protein